MNIKSLDLSYVSYKKRVPSADPMVLRNLGYITLFIFFIRINFIRQRRLKIGEI